MITRAKLAGFATHAICCAFEVFFVVSFFYGLSLFFGLACSRRFWAVGAMLVVVIIKRQHLVSFFLFLGFGGTRHSPLLGLRVGLTHGTFCQLCIKRRRGLKRPHVDLETGT